MLELEFKSLKEDTSQEEEKSSTKTKEESETSFWTDLINVFKPRWQDGEMYIFDSVLVRRFQLMIIKG